MEYFQDDLFPDTAVTWESVMSSKQWYAGEDEPVKRVSLCPSDMSPRKSLSQLSQSTRYTDPILVQCWNSVADGGPTLYQHWVGVSCGLGLSHDAKCLQLGLHSHPTLSCQLSSSVLRRKPLCCRKEKDLEKMPLKSIK